MYRMLNTITRNATLRLSLCIALCVTACAKADDALPTGEALMEKYLEVTGGKPAYQKIRSFIKHGHFKLPSADMSIPVTIYAKAPSSLSHISESDQTGRSELTTDGRFAWSKSSQLGGDQLLENEMAEQIIAASLFNPELHWRKRYTSVECVGIEEVDGKPCYKVVRIPDKGIKETIFIDKESSLIVMGKSMAKTEWGGEQPVEVFFRDYKKAGDITLAFTQVQKMAGVEQQIVLDDVQFNVEIPPSIFAMPESIKTAIAEKKKNAASVTKPANDKSSD